VLRLVDPSQQNVLPLLRHFNVASSHVSLYHHEPNQPDMDSVHVVSNDCLSIRSPWLLVLSHILGYYHKLLDQVGVVGVALRELCHDVVFSYGNGTIDRTSSVHK